VVVHHAKISRNKYPFSPPALILNKIPPILIGDFWNKTPLIHWHSKVGISARMGETWGRQKGKKKWECGGEDIGRVPRSKRDVLM